MNLENIMDQIPTEYREKLRATLRVPARPEELQRVINEIRASQGAK